ncbi:hypothetical protein SprV_1002803300 [Sparganum proliferum]
MQRSMDIFSAACENFGLVINTQKTVVIHQRYLGSTLSRNTYSDDEVANRISKASQAFGRLKSTVWNRHGLHLSTKLKICLRRILRLNWQDRIPGTDLLERTGIPSTYTILRQIQLRWSGHLSSLKRLQINPTNWEEIEHDRPTWRRTVKTGAPIYEANCFAAAEVKHEFRKSQIRPEVLADAQPLPTCPRCQRTFRSRIELFIHLRTNCASRTAPTIVPPPSSSSSSLPQTNSDSSSEPPLPSSSSSSSSSSSPSSSTPSSPSSFATTTPITAAQAAVSHFTKPDTTTDTPYLASDSSDEDQDYTCSHCDRTFTSRIGLVGHLRIHRTETGEPVSEAPKYTYHTDSTAHTALTLSCIAWVYSATCASTRAELTAVPTHPSCHTPRPLHHMASLPSVPQLTPIPPTSPVHTANAHLPLASAWSVTFESIAQRLANQCLEHQPTPNKLDLIAHTVLALSGIAWAYSVTCASTRAELTAVPTLPPHLTHPPRPVRPSLLRSARPSPLPPPPLSLYLHG